MDSLITHFGDSSSGLGALGVDGKAFVIQLITFVLAFFVLKKFAFKPILAMLDERHKTIDDGVKLGEKMKQDQAALQATMADTLAKARREADAIIAQANDTGRQAVRAAEEKARDKAAGILKEAESRIVTDTQRARKQLEKELVGLIADVSETVIGEKVDTSKDTQLIERALQERQAA